MAEPRQPIQGVPVLDHFNQALLDHLAATPAPPIYTLTPQEAREVLLRTQSAFAFRPDSVVRDWRVNSNSQVLRLRTIRPRSAPDFPPVILYFHGAGWVMGDCTTHDRLMTELAVGTNAVLLYVDYDRAPEHR